MLFRSVHDAAPAEATPPSDAPARRSYFSAAAAPVASSEAEAPAQPEPHQPSSAAVAAQAPAPQPEHTAAANSAPAEAAPAAAPVAAAEADAATPPADPAQVAPSVPAPAAAASTARAAVQAFVLPVSELQAVAQASGLQWVHTDAERLAAVQAAIAAEPQPVRIPRERPPVVVLDEGPLVLVETRRDLRDLTLPFDAPAADTAQA